MAAKEHIQRKSIGLSLAQWSAVRAYGRAHGGVSDSAVIARAVDVLLKTREAEAVTKAEKILAYLELPTDGLARDRVRDFILESTKGEGREE